MAAHDGIRVIAKITAQPDKVAPLKTVLTGLVKPTRGEDACVSYQLLCNAGDACEFVFVEEWKSLEGMQAHLQTPHVQDALGKAESLLAKAPEIVVYSVIE